MSCNEVTNRCILAVGNDFWLVFKDKKMKNDCVKDAKIEYIYVDNLEIIFLSFPRL